MSVLDTPLSPEIQEDSVPFLPQAAKAGVIGGLILTAVSFAANMSGIMTSSLSSIVSIVLFLIYIGWAYKTSKDHRDNELGGLMSLRRGFRFIFVLFFVMSLISTLFSFLYTSVIDPNYTQEIIDKAIEDMQKQGLPEEQIEASMSIFEMIMNPSTLLIIGLVGSVVLSAFFAWIMAMVMKREPKKF